MIQIHAGDRITYDSRLQDYSLLGLNYTAGVNKAGTATIIMPPGHPAYDAYKTYKDVVTIYHDDELVFRGRAIQPSDDFYKRRTILCEGERCFFMDSVVRPYLYQDEPAAILADLVATHNSQVEADKQFILGTVTVTDPNNYVRLESSTADKTGAALDKLVERCGGYIVFTTTPDGQRAVNWYAELEYRSSQAIEFGKNLTDFTSTTTNANLATRIVPYGQADETTGERVTIESVNNGQDYIEDVDAVALRGVITAPVYWDDVSEPVNLLRKAQEYLALNRNLITSLQLTAVDLAARWSNPAIAGTAIVGRATVGAWEVLKSFKEGDLVRIRSKPHEIDEDFLLTDRTIDLLTPGASVISMGKDVATLTGASSAASKANRSDLAKVEHNLKAEYKRNLAEAMAAAELSLSSLIEQTSESILLQVSETYATNDQVLSEISTSLTQLSDSFNFEFSSLKATVDENDAEARLQFEEIKKYIVFKDGEMHLGSSDSPLTLTIENDRICFRNNGAVLGWWDGVDFHTGNIVIEVNERAQFGNFAAIPRKKGNLSWLKVKN